MRTMWAVSVGRYQHRDAEFSSVEKIEQYYRIDENGLITRVDLIIATGHNYLAMNMGVTQVAKHYIKGGHVTEPMLNRIEAVIRTYDPCLSCSTHAFGQMPMQVRIIASDGTRVKEVARRLDCITEAQNGTENTEDGHRDGAPLRSIGCGGIIKILPLA